VDETETTSLRPHERDECELRSSLAALIEELKTTTLTSVTQQPGLLATFTPLPPPGRTYFPNSMHFRGISPYG
jgi:hypothetical protein